VYSILFEDPEGFGSGRFGRIGGYGPNGKSILQQISNETGGRFFEVSKKLPIDKVFSEIEEDLRSQYSIGYTPDQAVNRAYRRIHLSTKQKGLTVQTREGYYPA
jgi:VWFA-related protein